MGCPLIPTQSKTMFIKALCSAAFFLLAASGASAQSSESAPNAHKAYDQKLQNCRKQGAAHGLSGEALRTFVASCMKEA